MTKCVIFLIGIQSPDCFGIAVGYTSTTIHRGDGCFFDRQKARAGDSHRPASLALGVALAAISLVAYIPIVHGGFIWDDPDYVINNGTLRTLRGLWNIWAHPSTLPQYYPLVHTTFWVEFHLWALKPIGYHVDNVILHVIGALLLWRVLRTIELPGAWLAAAIWAVHPVNVESVAWITERKNVLSGVFYFASALVYLRGMERPGWGFAKGGYWLSLVLFIAALFSKSVSCSLPAALLLVIWWKRGRVRWNDLVPVAPMFVLGAAMAFWTAHLESTHVGAAAPNGITALRSA